MSLRNHKTRTTRKLRILIPTILAPECIAILKELPNVTVTVKPGLSGSAFARELQLADAVIIRSEHTLDARLIQNAPRLRVIARAGVGVENIDVAAASRQGIVVINAPGANSIAVAELTMAFMLALLRRIVGADRSVKSGEWQRSRFAGHELSGKTLGLLGFGRIGRAVSTRAQAFGMNVITFDPFIGQAASVAAQVKLVKLPELLRRADVISLHLPLTDKTRGLIGSAQLRRMKPTAILINAARGGVIDEAALQRALTSGQIAGCALDVFEDEPPADQWFSEMDNMIVTPHIGAATVESQTKVGIEIAHALRRALLDGVFQNAINLPVSDVSDLPRLQPHINLMERMGRLLRALESGACDAVTFELGAETIGEADLMVAAGLKGILSSEIATPVTLVNAAQLAKDRHLRVATIERDARGAKSPMAATIVLEGKFGRTKRRIVGEIENGQTPKIRQIDDFPLDLIPTGRVLFFDNRDRPGVIGAVGVVLGKAEINIASWVLGRRKRSGTALGVVTVDDPVPPSVIKELRALPNMGTVVQVDWNHEQI